MKSNGELKTTPEHVEITLDRSEVTMAASVGVNRHVQSLHRKHTGGKPDPGQLWQLEAITYSTTPPGVHDD